MPLTEAGIYYADTSTTMSIADITAAMATSMSNAVEILQVVHNSTATEVATTSTSYASSGLTASITPKYATSKILVMVSTNITTASATAVMSVFRGTVSGVNLAPGTWGYGRALTEQQTNWAYLDSPATTSTTTYTLGFKVATTGTAYAQNASTPGRITLMEVAA